MSSQQDQSAAGLEGGRAEQGLGTGRAEQDLGTGRAEQQGRQGYVPRPAGGVEDSPQYGGRTHRREAAVYGFTAMAAVLMMLSGAWNFLVGLAAIIRHAFFFISPNYAYHISVHAWGVTGIVVGAVVFAAGLALFMDMMWARVLGVIVAGLSAVMNFLFLPFSPIWSLILIVLDVVIIWALCAPRHRASV